MQSKTAALLSLALVRRALQDTRTDRAIELFRHSDCMHIGGGSYAIWKWHTVHFNGWHHNMCRGIWASITSV